MDAFFKSHKDTLPSQPSSAISTTKSSLSPLATAPPSRITFYFAPPGTVVYQLRTPPEDLYLLQPVSANTQQVTQALKELVVGGTRKEYEYLRCACRAKK